MLHWVLALATALAPAPIDKQYDVPVGGMKLHVHVRGTDPANPYVLYLHGGPGYSALPFMATTGAELESWVNMVYLDQRGCGLSDRLKPEDMKACTIAAMTEDIEVVRKQLGIEKWGVIGHAFGGLLGIRYAAEHPDRVTFLIGISSVVSVPTMTDDIFSNAGAKFKGWTTTGTAEQKAASPKLLETMGEFKALSQKDPRRLAGALSFALNEAQLYFADPSSATIKTEVKKLATEAEKYKIAPAKLDLPPEPSLALVENDSYPTMDVTRMAQKVMAPTLLVGGRQDGVVTVRHLEIARRAIKDAHLEIIDDCGHFAFYEQPMKLLTVLLRFIQHPK